MTDDLEEAQIVFGTLTPRPGLFTSCPTARDVAKFLRLDEQSETLAHLQIHLNSVISMVRAYTRGTAFRPGVEPGTLEVREDVAGVLVQCAGRSASNPTASTRIEIGGYSEVMRPFDGFLLSERMVLDNYRRRSA
ncbi:hypothetical protein [Sporichthya polymorpha]|uniref:hypothetical protein n=1 Tax=Sporichthya polymorpha TaxID=35751 RepID=UPI00037C8B89|nr:hypothetical protein [Sporichthya polymorpha]